MTFKWILSRMYIIMVGAGGGGETGMHVICYRENIPNFFNFDTILKEKWQFVLQFGNKFVILRLILKIDYGTEYF